MSNYITGDQVREIHAAAKTNNQTEIVNLILGALNHLSDNTTLGHESAIWRLVDAATLCAKEIGIETAEKVAGIREATGRGGKLTIERRRVSKIAYAVCDNCDRRFGVGTTHCSYCYC